MRTLSQAVQEAVNEYLKYNTTAPQQFNLSRSKSKGWRAEFHENKTCWNEGFVTWNSDKVLDIFFSQSDEFVDVSSWENDWDDE